MPRDPLKVLLGEFRSNFHPRCIRITARAQDVVNIILRNEHRKAEGVTLSASAMD